MPDPDLVTILRHRHACVTGVDFRITNPIDGPTIFAQAADEIERLRVECTRLAQRYTVLVIEIDELRAVRDALYKGEG